VPRTPRLRPAPCPPSDDPGARGARLEAAKRAVAVVFGVNGFVIASWLARLPAVRDLLRMTPGELGLLLLCVSVGSVSALLTSGVVVHRIGPRRACLSAASVMSVALSVAGLTPAVPVLAVALMVVGAGTAVWDVAMNVEGAGVERLLDRPIMPRFHAGWSLGTAAGAGIGAAAAGLHVPVSWHLVTVCALALASVTVAVRWYVGPQVWGWPDGPAGDPVGGGDPVDGHTDAAHRRSSGVLRAWREPRTVLIGLLALGMGFAEGAANDWLAVGLVDGYGVSHAVAALGFGVFVTAMTVGRLVGPWTLSTFGRVRALRAGAVTVAVGVLAVQAGAAVREQAGLVVALLLAAAGSLTWGAGTALGFPVAMSAAADDPRFAAARVSVVSAIGYVAFLAGPPVLGLFGDRFGVVRALAGVGAAVLLSLVVAGAARESEAGYGR
jgi:fucose permease